jgi:lipoate-protein ligase A
MPWRLLEDTSTDIYKNLSIDEAIAKVCAGAKDKTSIIRFWKADRSVVIGRFQCVHEEANLSFCTDENIAIARRFTGGGAVYHDLGNLNFSICADQEEECVSKTLMGFYETFIGAVRDALRALGVPARYDEDRACLRIGTKKITGTAGWIKRGVSFLHGTLLLDSNLTALRTALTPQEGQQVYLRDRSRIRCKPSKRDIVTNVLREVENGPSEETVRQEIVKSLQELLDSKLERGSLTREEIDTAEALYQSRYSQSAWNLGTPASD